MANRETPTKTTPIYLSGASRPELESRSGFGFMRTPQIKNRPLAGPWAADTGLFSAKGERAFNLDSYLAWLDSQDASTCLFATAPDKICDPVETLRRSAPVFAAIRERGYKPAFVAQDGLEHIADQIPWDDFDVLFIGGSTEWKLGPAAAALVREAKSRGKLVHMGRVNSERRYQYAARIGCDSVDGTFLAFGPEKNLPRLTGWVERARIQGELAA